MKPPVFYRALAYDLRSEARDTMIGAPADKVTQEEWLRKAATALDELTDAIDTAVVKLGEWLTDNTEEVFEEEPEIDGVRGDLDDAVNPRANT